MEGKDNISEELRLISGFVAGVSRVTPYGLPDGYFESLAGKVILRLRAGEAIPDRDAIPAGEVLLPLSDGEIIPKEEISPDLGSPAPVYSVPTGYFEGFAEKLMSRIKAGQDVGRTAEQGNNRPGIADPGLQDSAADQNPLEELAILSPLLSRIDKKMPFEVPEGYFSSLEATAAQLAREADSLSSLLSGLKNKPVFQAPEGYFDELADTILEKVKQQDRIRDIPAKQPAPAKIISFGRRRNWWKYAAAALVSGLILTGGWLKLHTPASPGPVDISKSLSNVSDQEIENYLDNQNTPLADDLANSTASLDITDSDIKNLLGDVPDGELKEYIEEHGDAKDLATN